MTSYKTTVAPPKIGDAVYSDPLVCGSGPCHYWSSVHDSLHGAIITPVHKNYTELMQDIKVGLQYIFQTRSNFVLGVSGAAHAGAEAIITNLVAPGETLFVAYRGMWDLRAEEMAKRFGIKTITHKIPLNAVFTVEELEPYLSRYRPKAMFITHGDSSTGTVQKLVGLGDLCHKYGTLLIVDTVVSLGGAPFLMDAWGVDAVYTGLQKALGGPAGIAPLALSPLAEKVLKEKKHQTPFYLDLLLLAQQWNVYEDSRYYHHTFATPLVWALRACLRDMSERTLEVSWKQHEAVMQRFCQRLEEYSFELFVKKPEDRLQTVTTIVLPKIFNHKEFINYMMIKHNIIIYGGLGPTVNKILRVGFMAKSATFEIADRVSAAMADTYKHLSKKSAL